MLHVALATDAAHPELDEDGPSLLAALEARGVEPTTRAWTDPSVDWAAFDLVLVRSTWDYTGALDAYLAWARGVPRLQNPASVLAWNTTKTYLCELERAGIPVLPTTWLPPGSELRLAPSRDFVVKPDVSAGARDTSRYAPDELDRAREHVRALHARGRTAMVQPYLEEIERRGETALFYFGGRFSHAIRKEPLLVRGRTVPQFPATAFVSARSPSDAELALAERVLELAPGAPLVYARVDLVPDDDGAPVLIELEITEPRLFLATSEGAVDRLADVVVAAAREARGQVEDLDARPRAK